MIPSYKIVVVGESGVGKSSLIMRLVDGKFGHHLSTICTSSRTKQLFASNNLVELEIWDTAGQERFREQMKMYMQNAKGGLIIFDMSNPQFGDNVLQWIQDIRANTNINLPILLAGNKSDLIHDTSTITHQCETIVHEQEISSFIYCSALTGQGVEEAFSTLAAEIVKIESIPPYRPTQAVEEEERSGCC